VNPIPSVLFVCLGNICRSPTAEAVFSKRAHLAGQAVHVDGAGTIDWHQGDPPDRRAISEAAMRGYDLSGLRARKIQIEDFHHFDFILAMDRQNLADLEQIRPDDGTRPRLFLDYAPAQSEREVPDPYYGGDDGFARVLYLIEQASDGLLANM